MLKIVSIISNGYPIVGGAQRGNIAFLKSLSEKFQYDCYIYTDSRFKISRSYGNVKLRTFRDTEELKSMMRDLKPRLIIGNLFKSFDAAKIAKQFRIPLVVYMHDYIYCLPTPSEEKAWRVGRQANSLARKEIDFVLKEADAVLANSYYLKKRLEDRYGIRPKVIYYTFDPAEFLVGKPASPDAGYITCVNGVWPHKGAHLLIALAKIFKKEKFLIPIGDNFEDPNYLRLMELFKRQSNILLAPFGHMKKYLCLSKIVLVPSQWPEPFGRIAVEAMASGIPLLASYTGGLKEIVEDSSLGVKNFRSINAWRNKLEKLLSSPKAYALNAKQEKILAKKYLNGNAAEELNNLIRKLIKQKKAPCRVSKRVAICGGTTQKSAYSLINAAWSGIAKKRESYPIVNLKNPADFSVFPIDCFIHHDYSQDFKKVLLPAEGKFIAVRTWDFGKFPVAWIKKINEECDQLWVHTKWVRVQAIKSGIPKARVKIVPHGIDEKIFRPEGRVYQLPTEKKFKFIFVGGAVERKGVDILLKAYNQAFSPLDDVCLVIKGNAKDFLYEGLTLKNKILKMAKDKNSPEIIYIDRYFSCEKLASLYRACDAGVFPYRAEGFAMPILEAMACGAPCIVPNFGACLDFCSATNSFLMPVKRINLPVGRSFKVNREGFEEEIEEIDMCEVLADTLADYMRKAYHLSKEKLREKSRQAAKRAHTRFKWSDSLAYINRHLKDLNRRKTPVRLLRSRQEQIKFRKRAKIIDAAIKMYFFSEYARSERQSGVFYDAAGYVRSCR